MKLSTTSSIIISIQLILQSLKRESFAGKQSQITKPKEAFYTIERKKDLENGNRYLKVSEKGTGYLKLVIHFLRVSL